MQLFKAKLGVKNGPQDSGPSKKCQQNGYLISSAVHQKALMIVQNLSRRAMESRIGLTLLPKKQKIFFCIIYFRI